MLIEGTKLELIRIPISLQLHYSLLLFRHSLCYTFHH